MEIITTKEMVDQIYEEIYARERGFLEAERENWERLEMEVIMQDEKSSVPYAKVQLGKVGKQRKFEEYAKVGTTKIPRFIKERIHFKNL